MKDGTTLVFLSHPALVQFTRSVMADGRERTANDICVRASQKNIEITPTRAGRALGDLEASGYLRRIGGDRYISWKLKAKQ